MSLSNLDVDYGPGPVPLNPGQGHHQTLLTGKKQEAKPSGTTQSYVHVESTVDCTAGESQHCEQRGQASEDAKLDGGVSFYWVRASSSSGRHPCCENIPGKKKNILKKKIRIKMLDCGINQADVLTREIDTDHILGTLPFDPESVETGKESWRR